MKKIIFVLCCILLLTLTAAFAENSLGGTATNSADVSYAFAWSAERDEQSAPLGDKAELHLTLLQNEWESFFVQVKTAAPDQAVTAEITPFTNENGDTFDAKVYTVGYETAEDGSSIPKTLAAFDGAPVALTAAQTTSFLVEVHTVRETPDDDYAATLTLKAADGSVLLEKEITATVYPLWFSSQSFVESSVGAKGKLQKVTGGKPVCFLGYQGNSYDYFRLALEFMGEDWLNEHFDNVVAELDQHMNDVEFFAEARPRLAQAMCGDNSEFAEPRTLQFGEDGKFTILVLADIQVDDTRSFNEKLAAYYRATIEEASPDLIVLLGDNIDNLSVDYLKAPDHVHSFMSVLSEYDIPIAMVWGNHELDDQAREEERERIEANKHPYAPLRLLLAAYQTYDCFVGVIGEDMTGLCNYNLPILSSDGANTAFNLWFIDSGAYKTIHNEDGYACVAEDQIAWYVETSNELKAANGGEPVPSINFQHIIVPEIFEALVQTESGWALPEGNPGVMNETPCPPDFSNGQFAAFVAQGDVIATVHGHDHVNSFVVTHQGIDIVNTPTCSTSPGHDENLGIRVIELNESNLWDYTTWIIKPADVGLSVE